MLNFNSKKYVSHDNLKLFNGLMQKSLRDMVDTYKSKIASDVQNKFNELSGKAQGDSEVIDARKGHVALRSKIDEIDSQLEHIANIVNLIEGDYDNSDILNDAISKYETLQLPTNKTFIFKKSLIINKSIKIIGNNTTLIFDCNDGFIVSASGFEIKGVNIRQKTLDYSQDKTCFKIGKNNDGKYSYTKNHILRDVNITNFTTSIFMESVYWVELHNVTTFKDKIGFSLNQHSTSDNNPTTTLKMDRVYFKGSGNEFAPVSGSVGIKLKNVVNMSANMIASEWYEECGYFDTLQAVTFNEPYFELCSKGVTFWNITGCVTLVNPYVNLLNSYAIKHGYGNITIIGGRAILNDGIPLYSKKANSTMTIIKDISLTGGTRFESTGYQNTGVISMGTDFVLKDNGEFKVVNQGYRETSLSNGKLSTNLNDMPLNITIGSYNLGNFTINGLELNHNMSVFLRSPDLSKWKLSISDSGVISSVKV